jgi:L-seryl-tRNA(Ser) seleniumtransferase
MAAAMTESLRHLPSVDEILRAPQISRLRSASGHGQLTDWTRTAIEGARRQIMAGDRRQRAEIFAAVIDWVLQQAARDRGHSVTRVINATGIILHTNLGRAPLAESALARLQSAARYTNVELDLESGRRSHRGQRVVQLLSQLFMVDDALIVNNCAAATMLVLTAIASGREVIVSRGQLVEIGGGFRLPDVFMAAGVVLREVGTTNRTYVHDYTAAMSDQTAAIIRVHHSNFVQTGFVTEPSLADLVAIKRGPDLPVIDDLGSGCVYPLAEFGCDEPTVSASVQTGADLTLFSGDKLFGGPQAGIIIGRREWIDRLRRHPMMRAMRTDKLTLAALEATTEIYLSGLPFEQLPVLRMISQQPESIQQQCRRLVAKIEDRMAPGIGTVAVVPCESQIGGGSAPGQTLPSFGIQLTVDHVDRVAHSLRSGSPTVHARIADNALLLDLRTVATDELDALAGALAGALRGPASELDSGS